MNAWLYPVSRNGGHSFRDAAGRRRPATVAAIREAVEAGKFPFPAEWTCAQNGSKVRPGDAVYLYSGDAGIFAAGVIAGAKPTRKTTPNGAPLWLLSWELDEKRTARLLNAPVPAETVRRHVHPRVTVRNFSSGAKALRRQLA